MKENLFASRDHFNWSRYISILNSGMFYLSIEVAEMNLFSYFIQNILFFSEKQELVWHWCFQDTYEVEALSLGNSFGENIPTN